MHPIESLDRCVSVPTAEFREHLGARVRRELPVVPEDRRGRTIGIPAWKKFSLCNRCGAIVAYLSPALAPHQRKCVCGSGSWEMIDEEQRKAMMELED